MSQDLISIIVPIYNVDKYIERCVLSLLNQTYKNLEIILIDDGSPDSCPQLCDDYSREDIRVKVIHKQNAGLGMARNSGIDVAQGKYIVFVDSDDYVTYDMCEKLHDAAVKYQADVVYGGIYYVNGTKFRESACTEEISIWSCGKEKDFLLEMIGTKPKSHKDTIIEVSVWKALFKKEVFDKHNIRFVSERQFISEDVIFNIDYLQHVHCVVLIPDLIYYYCENPVSLSKSFRLDRFEKVKILYDEIKIRLTKLYEMNTINERCDRFLIARARRNARKIVQNKRIIGKKKMRFALKNICEDPEFQEVLKRYPIHLLPMKHLIVAFLMRFKCYYLLEIILGK